MTWSSNSSVSTFAWPRMNSSVPFQCEVPMCPAAYAWSCVSPACRPTGALLALQLMCSSGKTTDGRAAWNACTASQAASSTANGAADRLEYAVPVQPLAAFRFAVEVVLASMTAEAAPCLRTFCSASCRTRRTTVCWVPDRRSGDALRSVR